MSTIALPDDVDEAARWIVAEAKRLGVRVGHNWGWYFRDENCGCAAGIVAISADHQLINETALCQFQIEEATGLSEDQVDGLSDGFEDIIPDETWEASEQYSHFYAIGARVRELIEEGS